MASNNNFQSEMVEAHTLIQQGRHQAALSLLKVLIKKLPLNADVPHLMALAYKGLKQNNLAISGFRKSLELNKAQPEVYNNLANLQKVNNDFSNAEQNYLLAVALQPNYIEAHRNLALCYAAQEKFQKVIESSFAALEINPKDSTCLTLIADVYRQKSEFNRAIEFYQKALSANGRNTSALHNVGVSYHLQQKLEKARWYYQKAYELSSSTPGIVQSLAMVCYELGLLDQAVSVFELYLNVYAEDVKMHERFNDMLWETELKSDFGESYKRAIKKRPDLIFIRLSYVSQLFKAEQLLLAHEELNNAIHVFGRTAELLALEGEILGEQQRYAEANIALSRSLELSFEQNTARQLVKLNIIKSHYGDAQIVLDKLMQRFPHCQLNWAYQSLIWRLINDERYDWLMNYGEHIKTYTLETPQGYESLGDYLRSLEAVLNELHRTKNAPLHQTLRNGTQTAARLFHNDAKEIVLLKSSLAIIVHRYISQLPDDLSHPFLSRKSCDFEFSGSWSVKLQDDGFHVNHVHPDGWLSSSFYVSIPKSMHQSTDDLQGQLKFGESPLSLGDREFIAKVIKPEPGLVVLFPSYYWHGTFPLSTDESACRMTSPFDIIPK